MKLSVIIPTRNRATELDKALVSLTQQTISRDKYEIIIIDNGSKDDTRQIFSKYEDSFNRLRYYFVEEPGLHNGRHKGLFEAESDILVYADDDIEAFPTWLDSIYNSFSDKNVVLVGGKILPRFESTPPTWLLERWNTPQKNGKNLFPLSLLDFGDEIMEITPDCVYGCNFSIRKEILLKAGGFHPDGMPKELIKFRGDGESHVSQFVKDSGMKTIYNPKASVYHLVPKDRMTIKYFCERYFNQGISDSYTYIRKYRQANDAIINEYSIRYDLFLYLINKLDVSICNNNTIDRLIGNCYYKGYRYHSMLTHNDKILYNWIIKDNYM